MRCSRAGVSIDEPRVRRGLRRRRAYSRALLRPRSSLVRACAALLSAGSVLGVAGARADEAAAPAPAPMSWQNPVVAGAFADPSAARVDGVYWATATSTSGAPGFPLLRSTDLLHWQ